MQKPVSLGLLGGGVISPEGLIAFEQFQRNTGLTGAPLYAAWEAQPYPAPPSLWKDRGESAEKYCKRLHVEINESRARRNKPPLPGNGWDEYNRISAAIMGFEFKDYPKS